MGVETNRIETEFILKSVVEKGIKVTIHAKRKKTTGKIKEYILEKKIIIEADSVDKTECITGDKVSLYFSYFSHVMNFSAKILEISNKEITVSYPDRIFKNLSRKYERVPPPEGSRVVFSVKGEKFELDFPRTDEFCAVDYPEFNTDEYAVDNIAQLISDFRERITESVSSVNIITYRKQKPETLEEKIISLSGKVLYIVSTNLDLPENAEAGDVPVLTGEIIDSFIPEGEKQIKISNFEKSSRGIHSEIYCPVLYQEYVTGYIHIQNRDKNKSAISTDILEYVYQFSKVLAFSLKLNGYFKDKVETLEKHESTVLDISASGLLFGSNSKKLEKSFFLYSDIKIELCLGKKIIPISSRIMRKYKNNDTVFYGLIFLDIDQENFEDLFYLVYGRKISDDDIEKWEGGSAPPQINF